MKAFIAVISHEAGKIAKYHDFDTQAEANAHVAEYGGFVADCPGANPLYWQVGNGTLTYDDAQELADIQHLADTQYISDRRIAYPNIGDQLDAIWKQLIQDRLNGHAMIQEVDDLIGQINAVKAAHPKPE
jgi:hypothetical protein